MKRERELEQAVKEIVREGKRRNEKDQPLYPVIYEPAVLAFFGAPEALFEVLMDRPLLILSLLQANKALQSFFEHFPRIWILLTDALIEKAMGAYAAEIYPFFEIQWEKEGPGLEWKVAFIDIKKTGARYHQFYLKNMQATYEEDERPEGPQQPLAYYVVKPGDTWLSLYLELMHLVEWGVSVYEHGDPGARPPITNITFWSRFSDSLVLTQEGDGEKQQLSPPRYYEFHRIIRAIRDAMDIARKRGLNPYDYHQIELIQRNLMNVIWKTYPKIPEIIKLDESIMVEYRAQLYGDKGLYPTSEAQKAFFFRVVRALSDTETKEEMIRHYGEPFTFNCLLCQQETELVDPHLLYAFCSTACRTKYDQ